MSKKIEFVAEIQNTEDIRRLISNRVQKIVMDLVVGPHSGKDLFRTFFENVEKFDNIEDHSAFISPVQFDGSGYVIHGEALEECWGDIEKMFKFDHSYSLPPFLSFPNKDTNPSDRSRKDYYGICLSLGHEDNPVSIEDAEAAGFFKENDNTEIWILPIFPKDIGCEIQVSWKKEEYSRSEDDRDIDTVLKMWDLGCEEFPTYFKFDMIYYSSEGFCCNNSLKRVNPQVQEIVIFS